MFEMNFSLYFDLLKRNPKGIIMYFCYFNTETDMNFINTTTKRVGSLGWLFTA